MNKEKATPATATETATATTNAHRDLVVIVRPERGKNIGRGYMIARRGDGNTMYFLGEEEAQALARGEIVTNDEFGRACCGLFAAIEIGEKYAEMSGLRKCNAIKDWGAAAKLVNARRRAWAKQTSAAQNEVSAARRALLAAMLNGESTPEMIGAFRSASERAQKVKAENAPKIAKADAQETALAYYFWRGDRTRADLWIDSERDRVEACTLSQVCKSGAQAKKDADAARAKTRENLRKANEKERKNAKARAK